VPEPRLPDTREFDPKNPFPCEGCSNCCEYISTEIDKPRNFDDFDQIRWFIIHKDVWVYVDEEKDWYLQFNTRCEKLSGRLCNDYEHRPQICRDYRPVDCVRHGESDQSFSSST